MKRNIMVLGIVVLALGGLSLPATAKKKPKAQPPPNTSIAITTGQGLAGSLLYYPNHPTNGPRYLFAQVAVRLDCESRIAMDPVFTPSGTTTRTFFVAGNLAAGGGPHHLETTEATGGPGNNSIRKLDATLTPAPVKKAKKGKKGKKKKNKRPGITFTAATGTLSFQLNSQSGSSPTTASISRCLSGPVTFSSTSATGF